MGELPGQLLAAAAVAQMKELIGPHEYIKEIYSRLRRPRVVHVRVAEGVAMRTLRDLRERQVQLPTTNPPKLMWVSLDRSLEERQRIKPFSKVYGVWKDATRLL